MKKRKILMVHHSGIMGGAGVSLYNLYLSLRDKYDVVMYMPSDPPALRDFFIDKGIGIKTFDFRLGKLTYYSGGNSIFSLKFWYHGCRCFFQTKFWNNVINEENPALAIVNSKVLCWMGILFKQHKIKSVCFVRETIKGNSENLMNRTLRCLLDNFNMVTFLSRYDRDQTKLIKAEPIITPDYLDPADYTDKLGRAAACDRLGLDTSVFHILFVGGINRLKGVDLAVEAMQYLKDFDVKLVVAGPDGGKIAGDNPGVFAKLKYADSIKFSKYIRNRISHLGLEDRITYIGVQRDMSVVYAASDVLIFPMREPHQARPAFEIGVQHKFAIIADYQNIREYVIDGFNGVTFRPDDPTSLAEAIKSLLRDPQTMGKYGRNNYRYTIDYHTEEKAMEKLMSRIAEELTVDE